MKYGGYFLTGIDSFLTLFMANMYFPIIPIYVVIMVISFIIMVVTLGEKRRSKFVKIVNIVFFTLIQMLFVVFLYVVESSNIDLSSNTGLYTNDQTLTLLELGVGLFLIWIVILFVILYLKKADKIFKVKVEEHDDFDEYINDYNVPQNNNVVNSSNNSVSLNNNVVSPNNNVVQSLVPEVSNFEVRNEFVDVNDPTINVPDSITDVGLGNGLNVSGSNFSQENILGGNLDSVSSSTFNQDFNTNNLNVNLNQENVSSNFNNNVTPNIVSSSNVFDNFQFLNTSNNNVERKNDDVEIIDFDL